MCVCVCVCAHAGGFNGYLQGKGESASLDQIPTEADYFQSTLLPLKNHAPSLLVTKSAMTDYAL